MQQLKSKQPLVSIVMPSFNKVKHISESIDSVLGQTYQNWELIIVDDTSNDGSDALIQKYASENKRILFEINQENKGANYCRNRGINLAKGEFLLFMDADDLLHKNCLLNRVETLMSDESLDFAVFTMQVFHKTIGDDKRLWQPKSKKPLQDFLAHNLPWQTMQPLWRKEFINQTKGFDERFERMQDVDFHTSVLLHKPNFKMNDSKPDCYYRIDEKRKNFKAFQFLERWVNSAVLYVEKYKMETNKLNINKYLIGTIYQTYVQLLFDFRYNNVTKAQFVQLKSKLFSSGETEINAFRLLLFRLVKSYHLSSIRIPGINFMLKRLIIF